MRRTRHDALSGRDLTNSSPSIWTHGSNYIFILYTILFLSCFILFSQTFVKKQKFVKYLFLTETYWAKTDEAKKYFHSYCFQGCHPQTCLGVIVFRSGIVHSSYGHNQAFACHERPLRCNCRFVDGICPVRHQSIVIYSRSAGSCGPSSGRVTRRHSSSYFADYCFAGSFP